MKYLISLILIANLSPHATTGQSNSSELQEALQGIQAIYNDVPRTCPQTRNWLNKIMQMYRCLQAAGDCNSLMQDTNTLAIGEMQREIEARPECAGASERFNKDVELKEKSEYTKTQQINSQSVHEYKGRYLDDTVDIEIKFAGKYIEVSDPLNSVQTGKNRISQDDCALTRRTVEEMRKRAEFLKQQAINQTVVLPIYEIDDALKRVKGIEIKTSTDCSSAQLNQLSKELSSVDIALRQIEMEYERKRKKSVTEASKVNSDQEMANEDHEKNYEDQLTNWAGANYDEYAWMLIRYLRDRSHTSLKPIVSQLLRMRAPIEALENIRIIVCGGSTLGNIDQVDMDKITNNISNASYQVELRKDLRKKYCPED